MKKLIIIVLIFNLITPNISYCADKIYNWAGITLALAGFGSMSAGIGMWKKDEKQDIDIITENFGFDYWYGKLEFGGGTGMITVDKKANNDKNILMISLGSTAVICGLLLFLYEKKPIKESKKLSFYNSLNKIGVKYSF